MDGIMNHLWLCTFLLWALASCGSAVEDQIERLRAGGEEAAMAQQELLIAKGDAVPVLLAALDDPHETAGRALLAEVLVGLMVRVDDERISASLKRHLVDDPDPQVRARIAREIGILKRLDFADAFMAAIADTSGEVRAETLTALGFIRGSLAPEMLEVLAENARHLQNDENREARLGARIIVADHVDVWLTEAHKETLKGQLAVAESLYHTAIEFSPDSKKANLKLGRFYFDNGQEERGLDILRKSGWLVDVPVFPSAPVLDGRLDDAVWDLAPRMGPLFAWSEQHNASIDSKVHTEMYVGYTKDAIYFGARCGDPEPQKLVVNSTERDHAEPYFEDIVEFFIDSNFDKKSTCQISINSAGAIVDGLAPWRNTYDSTWDLESDAAAFVGDDFWSLEYMMVLGQSYAPLPQTGTIWGVDMQRGFRGGDEWSQWTRTYPDMSTLEAYGWFLFE